MRADAVRNRERIVSAALKLSARHGDGVSMEDIARSAGLGVGTLYRHFPDRAALLEEIAITGLTRMLEVGRAAAAEDVSRWEVLRRLMAECIDGPLALVRARPERGQSAAVRALEKQINALLSAVISDAQKEGSLRDDVPAAQVRELLSVAVCRPGARADDYFMLVLFDGLKAR
ncbi:TetR/AcrR family transcriptional regulator [Fodinicola acaciae]|uniref:TetR/AcrR family transcriptional regulator n=1 Tax=Fodinicola acaciae TaxID=2681555 RepID=UPI0013D1FC72|nr:TetR/AcrR family transcriptional regulator [Fodinicola acaciae]